MEKSVKRISIWKPLVLSITLILSAQYKAYAEGESEEEADLSSLSTGELIGVGAIVLGLILLLATSYATDDESSGTSSDTQPTTLSPSNSFNENKSSGANSNECAEARVTYNQIHNQCVINNNGYYNCDLDKEVLAAKRHADIMCK